MTSAGDTKETLNRFLSHLVDGFEEAASDKGIVLDLKTMKKLHSIPEELLQVLSRNRIAVLRTDVRSQGIGRFLVGGMLPGGAEQDGSVAILDLPQVNMLLRMSGESDLPRNVLLKDSSVLEDRVIGSVAEWHLCSQGRAQ